MTEFFIALWFLFWSVGRHEDLTFLGVDNGSPLWSCATFSFVHISFIHLLINCFGLYSLCRLLRHMKGWVALMLLASAFLSAYVMQLLGLFSGLTIGGSAMAFAALGIVTAEYDIKRRVRFYSSVALALFFPLLFPQINGLIHIFAYVFGFMAGKVYYFFFCLKRWM